MTDTSFLLDQLIVVKIDATLWGGRKKLRPEDLGLQGPDQLPPSDLASLGSKRIVDPKALLVFHRLKAEAERLCLRKGSRFLGGYALPADSAQEIRQSLERIRLRFVRARDSFVRDYDASVERWIQRHPDFADAIRAAVDPVEHVESMLRFEFLIYKVTPPAESHDRLSQDLEHKVQSLCEVLMREIAQDARELLKASLNGKDLVTRKILNPLRRMHEKLRGLAFLDASVEIERLRLEGLLESIARQRRIEGGLLQEVTHVVATLARSRPMEREPQSLTQEPFNDETQPQSFRLSGDLFSSTPEPICSPDAPRFQSPGFWF
jgi:hypothetical protein